MLNISKILFFIITGQLCLLISCDKSSDKLEDQGKVIAKVKTSQLYLNELDQLIPEGMTMADSTAFIQTYINKWAYNEAFYQQAITYLSEKN